MRRVRSDEVERMREDVRRLGPWQQNLVLPGGVETAPHAGADPAWASIADALPDLSGKSVLDVGCGAGLHCFELAKRGADVLGIDPDAQALEQARWARKKLGLHSSVRFRRMQVYDLAQYEKRFDVVLCLGVFQHFRYPLLALDILSRRVDELFVFQALKRQGGRRSATYEDVWDLAALEQPDWPCLSFIPGRLHDDPSHWWVPNQEGLLAMLQAAGFSVLRRLDDETLLCRPEHGPSEQATAELLSATGRPWRKQAAPRMLVVQGNAR